MGGAVSSGRDNNELVDNLMSGNYIRSRAVEQVFRVLDRADYMSPEARDQAYRDLAWRNGPLHLSAPCIYSEVMEALELKPGLTFLNIGSGTGYLSTLVGLIIGPSGISHGVEIIPSVLEYANKKISQFIDNSASLDEFDFCTPKYFAGNALCLAPTHTYDRVYCGAGVHPEHENYFKQLTKVGGVLVMPLAETLVQLRRVSETHWTRRNLLNVSFAPLREPQRRNRNDIVKLDEVRPAALQALCRGAIRAAMRRGILRRSPELRAPPPEPPRPQPAPRRIRIPCEAASDEDLNDLHDLDEASGAHEMNALLSLVLSMGQNRAAGSLRLDPADEEDEYASVGELYALGERRARPDDGVIVFDVAAGGMRARRWQPRRNRRARNAPAPDTDPEAERGGRARSEEAGTSGERARSEPTSEPEARPESPARARPAPRSPPPRLRTLATLHQRRSSWSDLSSDDDEITQEIPIYTRVVRPASPRRRTFDTRQLPNHRRASWTGPGSDDEDVTQANDNKRQKLDSGIGEGTASSGDSPDKSDATSAAADQSDSDRIREQDIEMPWYDLDSITSESSDTEDEAGEEEGEGKAAPPATVAPPTAQTTLTDNTDAADTTDKSETLSRADRTRSGPSRVRRTASDGSTRRVSLSLAMKRGVKELPLPHALKSYINYGRTYQF